MPTSAKMILDSRAPDGTRLATMEVCFARIVLSEWNTHRNFSRNSASSRAIPVGKMMAMCVSDPYLPVFQRDQKGMEGKENLDREWQDRQTGRVKALRDYALAIASEMIVDGVAKGDANRYLEPFLYHKVIVTATNYSNFFAQRLPSDAHPAIRAVAEMMQECLETHAPTKLNYDDWHLPYLQGDEKETLPIDAQVKLSVARCARVSYLSHDGVRDHNADFDLYDKLRAGNHFSPFEHVAQAHRMYGKHSGNFSGNFRQYRKMLVGECR